MPASVRFRKARGVWTVFFSRGPRRWNTSFGSGDAAEREAREVAEAFNANETARAERRTLLYPGAPAPFALVAEAWWDAKMPGMPNSSRDAKKPVVFSRLIPRFGDTDVRRIDEDVVRAAAVAFVELGHQRETVQTTGSILDSILSWAVRRGTADHCPALRAAGGRGARAIFREVAIARCPPPERVEAWTVKEVRALLRLAAKRGAWLADPVLFAAQTGCRRGELIALDWRDVDLESGRATIRQSESKGQRKTTKADKQRTIELAPETVEMLRRRAAAGRSGPVFRAPGREPWTDYGLSGYWTRLRAKAAAQGVRPFKFHCFRHTWATWALAAGHDPAWCAAQIGDTLEVFLQRYAHAMPREKRSLDFVSLSSQGAARPRRSPSARARSASPKAQPAR